MVCSTAETMTWREIEMGLFTKLHRDWLAVRIRELATTPIESGNPNSMTIRDAVARKFARDLLTDDPERDVERFLQDCEALS